MVDVVGVFYSMVHHWAKLTHERPRSITPALAPRGPALIDDAPPQPRGRLGSIAAPGPGWLDAPRPPSPAPAPGYDNTWTPSAYASEWQPGEPPRRAS